MAIEDMKQTSVIIVPRNVIEEVALGLRMPDEEYSVAKIIIPPELKKEILEKAAEAKKLGLEKCFVLLGHEYLEEKGLVQGGDASRYISRKLFEAWGVKIFLYHGKEIIVVGE